MRAVIVAAAFPHGRQLFNVLVIEAVGSIVRMEVLDAAGVTETSLVIGIGTGAVVETACAFKD